MSLQTGRMTIESRVPDPDLVHLVREFYFFSTGTRDTPEYVPVIDDGCYDFIFFREQDSTLTWGPRQVHIPIPFRAFTIHQLKPPYAIRFGKSLTFFTIKVQPWANAHFFAALDHPGVIDLMPLFPGLEVVDAEIWDSLSHDEKFQAAGRFIRGQGGELSPAAQLARQLCETIYKARGMVTVNALSEAFGSSRQYLGKVFRQEVLYSLKQFILTVRIMDLVKYRIRHPELSMTELCYRYNYFDQPHFNRDFKRVCGVTPTRFFQRLPEFLLRH
jgi:AraC-like DNA-binding protein